MVTANLLWGAPRIHGELLKLGIHVAEGTVSRLHRRPHPSRMRFWRRTGRGTSWGAGCPLTDRPYVGRLVFLLALSPLGPWQTLVVLSPPLPGMPQALKVL